MVSITSIDLPEDRRATDRSFREGAKESCKWINRVWAATLWCAPAEAEAFLLEISDSFLHAWPPLAAGRNIMHLHSISLHFPFCLKAAPISREFTKLVHQVHSLIVHDTISETPLTDHLRLCLLFQMLILLSFCNSSKASSLSLSGWTS